MTMQRTNARNFMLGVFYDFSKNGGLVGTVIRTGVFTIPNSAFFFICCTQYTLVDGNPAAKLEIGTVQQPGVMGTLGMGQGTIFMTPQPAYFENAEEIQLEISTDDITQGNADFSIFFVTSIR